MSRKMLENEKFEKREVNGEEMWKQNGNWKSKSEKWSCERCGYGGWKNGRERRLENEK